MTTEAGATELLKHVHDVLTAVEHYVNSNVEATNAFVEAVTRYGVTVDSLTEFQERRVSQFQALTAVMDATPKALTQLEKHHVSQ